MSRAVQLSPEQKKLLEDERRSLFYRLLKMNGISEPETEWKFHPTRHWRFDFAFPKQKVALEVEGAIWTNGRHTRPSGFVNDMDKYNAAAMLGWKLLRTTPTRLSDLQTVKMIAAALRNGE